MIWGGNVLNIALMNKIEQKAIKHRRYFHQYPELSGREWGTSEYITRYLERLDIEVLKYAEPSVVGYLKGKEGQKTIALRADMDALPVQEEGNKTYASRKEGISHACGHDGHMAILLAVAEWLSDHRDEIKSNVLFIFQSSEEISPSGAEELVKQGVLEEVDAIFGLHLWQPLSKGKIGFCAGPMMASVDDFKIVIQGKGGHGALPQETVDPIYISSHIIGAIQGIISRYINPLDPAVISIGKIESGSQYNVIPNEASMYGSIRTLSLETRRLIKEEMKNVVEGICKALGAKGELKFFDGLPPVINDEKSVHYVNKVLEEIFESEELTSIQPAMASEDFSLYLQEKQGAFIFIGMGGEKSAYPHHHSKFDIDEEVLLTGIRLLIQLVDQFEDRFKPCIRNTVNSSVI